MLRRVCPSESAGAGRGPHAGRRPARGRAQRRRGHRLTSEQAGTDGVGEALKTRRLAENVKNTPLCVQKCLLHCRKPYSLLTASQSV